MYSASLCGVRMAGMLWSSDVRGLCLLSMQVVAYGAGLTTCLCALLPSGSGT